ncbi:tRNA (adenosine(37)-N6)-threonylcarbamoyltransferase complex dimerization subunit type 1 TsaB [Paenibacillus senegalimassiliensis]|uniref:tRNA (adenosine(37)-N6)-threonylcarbamoyltransferase complex dimerization subunit type 1 TsaB n=1 Tax=Paenibacillus senegalimassiliensis TaxID=1737426 RepID=UPI00073E4E14|nr:tRNA (adenosine(37)-N6)-threonylcarbamoyltransferase complex dimerization subunit type 1 TsaB [Paenibacillus senegalimassiliensis]
MNQSKEDQQPRRLLAFDTSTSSLAVAVLEGGRLLAERNIYAERNHSAFLVTAISDCLAEAGLGKGELSGIAVGVGPGSYTGTRIAVTTAKTLAWSLKLPVYGVSSLAALALGGWATASGQDAAALCLLAARQGVEPAGAARPAEGLMDDWAGELARRLHELPPQERPAHVWCVGETSKHEAVLGSLASGFGELVKVVPYEMEGVWLGLTAVERSGYPPEDVHALEPNYTQLTEAEVKRQQKA